MPSFAESFLTGFMRDQTEVIRKRKDDGEAYFNNQLELARTRGLKNRDLTKRVMDGNLQIARQLEQVGVPKDLIMATAKQNPDDLGGVLEQIQKLQMEGVKPDEAFYRDLLQVSGTYKAPDEDLSTFMSNLYEPLRNNAQAAPPDSGSDSIWATMFGSNAMDRARSELDNTVVADGLTAGELLRYSDDPQPDTYGAPSVVVNAGLVGDTLRTQDDINSGGDALTPGQIIAINEAYNSEYSAAKLQAKEAWERAHPEDNGKTYDQLPPEVDQTARRIAANKVEEYGITSDMLRQIPRIWSQLGAEEEEEGGSEDVTTTTLPSETEVPEVPTAPPAPLTPIPPQVPPVLPDGATYYDTADDGTIVYIGKDGKAFRVTKQALGIREEDPSFNLDEILRNPTGN